VRFTVLALDYDGTIARDGVLDPDVRSAIADVRARGVTVLIVTGRILEDLRGVAGDLRFVDAVVGENGAVVAFPESGQSSALATAAPQALVDDLRRRRVPIEVGHSVVEADATFAPELLTSIRALEIPYVLLFNRGRLMALPSGVNKASGLREALRTLRLSPHNAIAIGDAENDHDLLEVCELGVAVSWGSAVLQQKADEVLHGTSQRAVAAYIRRAAEDTRLAPERVGRRRLTLGHDGHGKPVSLAVRGRNLLVAGDPKSGKSWVAGLLCEQLIHHGYSVCVIDPEGDYSGLDALPGVVRIGGTSEGPTPHDLRTALRYPDVNVVIDLSQMHHVDKWSYVRSLLAGIAGIRRQHGIPHRIIVDEAHYLLHDPDALAYLDLELDGYTLITYQPSKLQPELLSDIEAIVVTRLTDAREVNALAPWCADTAECHATLARLPIGQAAILPRTEEAGGALTLVHLAARLTPHVRHREKYIDVPVASVRAFLLTRHGEPSGPQARTLREFVTLIVAQPLEALDRHLRKSDFSRWIADVFGDAALAAQIREVEGQYQAGQRPDVQDAIASAIGTRYDLGDSDGWPRD
jgi:hydroxymethylpyrimidine pyrophosphatase-like HAD family hydrolase